MSVCPSVRHNIQKKPPKKPKNGIEIPKKKMKQKMKFQKTLLGSPLVFYLIKIAIIFIFIFTFFSFHSNVKHWGLVFVTNKVKQN